MKLKFDNSKTRKASGFSFNSDVKEEDAIHQYGQFDDISKLLIKDCPDLKQIADNTISLVELVDGVADFRMEQEFRIIGKITTTNLHAKKIVNYSFEIAEHNRYKNVFPFEFNRVKLTAELGIDFEPYINASFVREIINPSQNKYIAT